MRDHAGNLLLGQAVVHADIGVARQLGDAAGGDQGSGGFPPPVRKGALSSSRVGRG